MLYKKVIIIEKLIILHFRHNYKLFVIFILNSSFLNFIFKKIQIERLTDFVLGRIIIIENFIIKTIKIYPILNNFYIIINIFLYMMITNLMLNKKFVVKVIKTYLALYKAIIIDNLQ